MLYMDEQETAEVDEQRARETTVRKHRLNGGGAPGRSAVRPVVVADQPWDARVTYHLTRFIARASWRDIGPWVRRSLIKVVSFAYYHCRGLVSKDVYARRSATCDPCEYNEVRVVRSLPLFRKTTRRFCRAENCNCGNTRCAATDWKLRLKNYVCKKGKFGRDGWFPKEK